MRRACLSWMAISACILLTLAAMGRVSRGATAVVFSEFPPGISAIVFTQIPVETSHRLRPEARGMLSAHWGEGGRLMLLLPY